MTSNDTKNILSVFINGKKVGVYIKEKKGVTTFQYDSDWLSWENAFPVSLSLPLQKDSYGADKVLPVFDNLLPDNNEIRKLIADRQGAEGYDTHSILESIGSDCVGALQFLPEGRSPDDPGRINYKPISTSQIAEKLKNLKHAPLGMNRDEKFRISLAGAQEKTGLLYFKNQWCIPQGSSPTTHILKPQIDKIDENIDLSQSVENEYICMKLAEAFEIPTAKVKIETFDTEIVLIVERFDRKSTRDSRLLRLPQEDFCQILSVISSKKYESDGGPGMDDILHVLKSSNKPIENQQQFMKSIILFWLLGATDGHAKNFSIFLQPGGRFEITPLYDVMSMQPFIDTKKIPHKDFRLAMSVGDKQNYKIMRIYPRHFLQTAKKNNFPEADVEAIFDELIAAEDAAIKKVWRQLPKSFPSALANSIIGGLQHRMQQLRDRNS
jgi:serine/threonine-protein kinase HipA